FRRVLFRSTPNLNFSYVGNTRDSIRFKDRRERDFYALRCGPELGPQELALANADGPGLLRDRVNGGSCIALRYCSIRCRSDALFTAAMRCDDCGGELYPQKWGWGKKKFRGKAGGGEGECHGREGC